MRLKYLWPVLLLTGVSAAQSGVLSRKRRYLSFPEGSSFAASVCMTIGVIGNPVLEYMSWAVNWGIAYDLPNQTWVRQHAHGFSNKLDAVTRIRHRHRRDLYEKLEVAMDSMGYNGRDCIGRALCESANYFAPKKKGNMVEEIIKTILSFPDQRRDVYEDPDAHHYDRAFSRGRVDGDCQGQYPNCHISLLGMALGDHSVEPTKHGPRGALSFM